MERVTFESNGKLWTTSLTIAKMYKKQHCNVLRMIRTLVPSPSFQEGNRFDSNNIPQPIFNVDHQGYITLMERFRGAPEEEIHRVFISDFNSFMPVLPFSEKAAEESPEIAPAEHEPVMVLPVSNDRLIELLYEQLMQKREALQKVDNRDEVIAEQGKIIEDLREALKIQGELAEKYKLGYDFSVLMSKSEGTHDMANTAKILEFGEGDAGRNLLFDALKKLDIILDEKHNPPRQEYVKRGYFKIANKIYKKRGIPNAKEEPYTQTLVTQKGLAWLFKLMKSGALVKP